MSASTCAPSASAFRLVQSSEEGGEANVGVGTGAGGSSDVGASSISNTRGDRVGEPKYALGSSATVTPVAAVFAITRSASRCTMRVVRCWYWLVLERSSDGRRDEAAREIT
jgi:hypothetical protein